MLKRLILETSINGILRTRKGQDVESTARAVLERVGRDHSFAPLLDSYIYSTLHHFRPRTDPFDWQTTQHTLLADLVSEPLAGIVLEGPFPSASLWLHLNCENEIVRAEVDGKRRRVPKAGDRSTAGVSASAHYFTDRTFVEAYLNLASDLFEIIQGEYGYSNHLSFRHGNDFDRRHQNSFEPWFITWANFFGPELVSRLDRERLTNAPAYQVRELPGGSVVLTVAVSPLEQLDEQVQGRISAVKAHLGILSPSERASSQELVEDKSRAAARNALMRQHIEGAFQRTRDKTADEMQRQAEGCAKGVQRIWSVQLDFSPRSLALVDRWIRTGFGRRPDHETIAVAVQAFGAYAGEVVRRVHGGRWHDEEMKGQPILMNVGHHSMRVDPFRAVARRFAHRRTRRYRLPAWFEKIGDQDHTA